MEVLLNGASLYDIQLCVRGEGEGGNAWGLDDWA